MLCIDYRVGPSLIPGAGSGLFLNKAIRAGKVLIAPSHINATVPLAEILEHPDHPCSDSSIRWFEDHCTVSPDWPDECYVNHSFSPNGLWHLGFIFAARDLAPGEELTVDYRHLIGPEVEMPWLDAQTGRKIIGFEWSRSLATSTASLLDIVAVAQTAFTEIA